jgi:hypothetical protein
MPSITYIIRFLHREPESPDIPCDEQEFRYSEDAWEALRLFTEKSSSEIYSRVELVSYNWKTCAEQLIAALIFEPQHS